MELHFAKVNNIIVGSRKTKTTTNGCTVEFAMRVLVMFLQLAPREFASGACCRCSAAHRPVIAINNKFA